jgi:hypothetical protein
MGKEVSYAISALFVLLMAVGLPVMEYQQKKADLRNQENTGSYYRLMAIKEMAR